MPACPKCHGEKGHDYRDLDAFLEEHLTDEQLALVPNRDVKWAPCDECEGTGVVSEGRRRDLLAAARAHVDQIIAAHAERCCTCPDPFSQDGS